MELAKIPGEPVALYGRRAPVYIGVNVREPPEGGTTNGGNRLKAGLRTRGAA